MIFNICFLFCSLLHGSISRFWRCNNTNEMGALSLGLTIGLSTGVLIGVLLAGAALLCIRLHNRRSTIGNNSSRRNSTIPIRANGDDTSTILSDSTAGVESPKAMEMHGVTSWLEGSRRKSLVSASGVPKYSYKYIILPDDIILPLVSAISWVSDSVLTMFDARRLSRSSPFDNPTMCLPIYYHETIGSRPNFPV